MKKIIGEFKEFIMRGNVLDMAVGIVVGGAFTSIVTSLVNDIIMPCIGAITGKIDISALKAVIMAPAEDGTGGLVIPYGSFVQSVINFLIIAIVIFCVVKAINTMRAKLERKKEEVKEEEPPKPTVEQELLTEIRDLLKENK